LGLAFGPVPDVIDAPASPVLANPASLRPAHEHVDQEPALQLCCPLAPPLQLQPRAALPTTQIRSLLLLSGGASGEQLARHVAAMKESARLVCILRRIHLSVAARVFAPQAS
jgi:hypothetical protein